MFPYDLPFLPGSRPPERWDVVVFRYPEEPEVSYIKRLVGLPGETIRIYHGDIFIKPPGGDTYALARKPLWHQAAMQIAVYDDRHQPRAFAGKPQWRRWASENEGGWKVRRTRGKPVPVERQPTSGPSCATAIWSQSPSSGRPCSTTSRLPGPARATLVTDFYSYNTNMMAYRYKRFPEPPRPPTKPKLTMLGCSRTGWAI